MKPSSRFDSGPSQEDDCVPAFAFQSSAWLLTFYIAFRFESFVSSRKVALFIRSKPYTLIGPCSSYRLCPPRASDSCRTVPITCSLCLPIPPSNCGKICCSNGSTLVNFPCWFNTPAKLGTTANWSPLPSILSWIPPCLLCFNEIFACYCAS